MMMRATWSLVRCVEPRTTNGRNGRGRGTTVRCNGTLIPCVDEKQIECTRCGAVYPVNDEISHILPLPRSYDHYQHDEIIRTYYEAHYGPYIAKTDDLQARLTFPLSDLVARAAGDPPVESFTEVEWHETERIAESYRCITPLLIEQQLTEQFYQCILDLCRPYVQRATVLDLGCGLGRMAAELAHLGARHVLGLDRSQQMVQEAQRILRANGPEPVKLNVVGRGTVDATITLPWPPQQNLDFIVGDATRLPLRSSSFDLVTSLNLLDRIPDPQQMVDEVGRVLRPGGHVVITDPYDWENDFTKPEKWVEDMAALFDSATWKRVREVDGVPFVLRYYSRRISIYMNHCVVFEKVKV